MSQRRIAIVGAGIVGLAHAWAAVQRGHQVTVFEREALAIGASVRNFGLGLVLGQQMGEMRDLALRSREIWLELLPRIGAWHKAEGSLTVARDEAQWQVLQAFQSARGADYGTHLVTEDEVASHGAVGLGGLFSGDDISLDAREAVPLLARWLAEARGITFHYGVQVHGIELPNLETSHGRFVADEVVVCAGHDFQTLYPQAFAPLGLCRCALQMLRLANPGLRLQPALLTGLSCLHYPSFTQHAVLAEPLETLRQHVRTTRPELLARGIHLIVQQAGRNGELIVGDSHDYGAAPAPFSSEAVDDVLLAEAGALLQRPLRVLERWRGIYASGPRPFEVLQPVPGVRVVAITSGVGMSISLALAECHFAG